MSNQPRQARPFPQPAGGPRQNEYFVPRDGIDREVITSDICRYLGNDALVRPGTHTEPETGRTIQGYYITAYRNLTSAMIADLKNDSARWEAERRRHHPGAGTPDFSFRDWADTHARRPNSPPVRYQESQIRDGQQRPTAPSPGYGMSQGIPQGYAAPPPQAPRDYENARYPGSDAPGYSAAGPGGQPLYNTPGGYAAGNYTQGPPPQTQYASAQQPSQAQDPRYVGPPFPMTGNQGYIGQGGNNGMAQQIASEGYVAGANFAVANNRDHYGMDMSMSDAPQRRTSPNSGPSGFGANPRGAYGGNPSGPSGGYNGGYGMPVTSGPGPAYTSSIDTGFGRAPAGFNQNHDMHQPPHQYDDRSYTSNQPRSAVPTVLPNVPAQHPPSPSDLGVHRDRAMNDRMDRASSRDMEIERDGTPPSRLSHPPKASVTPVDYGRR